MKRIIVADDDEGIQDIITLILTKYGYDPEIHKDGHRLLNNDFDEPALFLIDKQLLDLNGLDICRALKSRPLAHTPVIIFSAASNLTQASLDAGADAFLAKPFTMKKLMEVIELQLEDCAN